MMNGTDSSCPMSRAMPSSKASCTSLVYSMKKRKVKISRMSSPKKKPVPTRFGFYLQ